MLATILLCIALAGLILTGVGLLGAELPGLDFGGNDTGFGAVIVPGITVATATAGLGILMYDTPGPLALLIGILAGSLAMLLLTPLLVYLMKQSTEAQPTEFTGMQVTIIEPATDQQFGIGEVLTDNGSTLLAIKLANPGSATHTDTARLTHPVTDATGTPIANTWYITTELA